MFAQHARVQFAAVLGALCVLTAQAPVPTTLPEIGRTHSKGFCTTVRDKVAPAVLGLMKTDELIGAGHRALVKMAADSALPKMSDGSEPPALELDKVYARNVVARMAHNLGVIKKMLSDDKRFPKKPLTDDDRLALLLKA